MSRPLRAGFFHQIRSKASAIEVLFWSLRVWVANAKYGRRDKR